MPKDKDVFKRCIYNAAHLKLPQRSAMQGARLVCAITEAAQDGKHIDVEFIAGGKGKTLDRAISTFLNEWGRYLRNCANGKQNQGKTMNIDSCPIDASIPTKNQEDTANCLPPHKNDDIDVRWMSDSCPIDASIPTKNQEDTANCLPPHNIYTYNQEKKINKKDLNFDIEFKYNKEPQDWEPWRVNFYGEKQCKGAGGYCESARLNCDVQLYVMRHILHSRSKDALEIAEVYGYNAEKIASMVEDRHSAIVFALNRTPNELSKLLTKPYILACREWAYRNQANDDQIFSYLDKGLSSLIERTNKD